MRRWVFVVVLAGCGSDGPKYDPPPPEAVASCSLVQKRPDSPTARHELWFDSAGRMIQADGYHGSSTFTYDDQDRLVTAVMASGGTFTWTYEGSRITAVTTHGNTSYTDVYELDASGRAMHLDGPNEHVDFTHDDAGHLTSWTGATHQHTYTYDPQGRLASSNTHEDPLMMPTSYTYEVGPAGVYIYAVGAWPRTYTYDIDGNGRIIRAAVDGTGYTYSYDGDRITAIGDDVRFEVESTGVCPSLTTTLQPYDPVPIYMGADVATLPNPPVEDFGYSQ